MKNKYIVGTRGSLLALRQTNIVINQLKEIYPDVLFEIKIIKTKGDIVLDKTLDKIGGKGLFINEIEENLINKDIDFAIHSLKDMPNTLSEEFCIAATPKREDPRDVLVTSNNSDFEALPKGSKIGTSSIRRTVQLKKIRPDLNYVPIRGNIDTRIQKMLDGEFDAIILAAAGLKRLELDEKISQYFEISDVIPAAGQGTLAIETRSDDVETINMIKKLNHQETNKCVLVERAFLKEINGGCYIPVGVYAHIEDSDIHLTGFLYDNERFVYKNITGNAEKYLHLGIILAQKIMEEV
jgi:hydroxymethylbilane synthase